MSEKMARRAIAVLQSEIDRPAVQFEGQPTTLCLSPTLEEVLLARFLRLVSLFERQDLVPDRVLAATSELTPPLPETVPDARDREPLAFLAFVGQLSGSPPLNEHVFAEFLALERPPDASVH